MNSISACGKTDIGQKRYSNEDSYAVELDYGLFIVADGMGGHIGGDEASTMANEKGGNDNITAILVKCK